MKIFFVILSLICTDVRAMLNYGVRVCRDAPNFVSACLQAMKTAADTTDFAKRCMDVVAGSITVKAFSSLMDENNRRQSYLMYKTTTYLNSGIIDKKQAKGIESLLEKSVSFLDDSLKCGIVAGLFSPMITQKLKFFPLTLGTVMSLGIAWIPLHRWEQQMKSINHCLDHPELNMEAFLKERDSQFNVLADAYRGIIGHLL